MLKLHKNSRGGVDITVIIIALVVLAGIGFAGYRLLSKDDQPSSSNRSVADVAETEVPCESDDKDLCKFFSSWKANQQYRMTVTSDQDGTSTFEVDGNKNRVAMTIDGKSYEVITIDKTTYTKAGSTWYKQAIKEADDDITSDFKLDFDEPSKEAKDTTTYKKLGKEACGNLTCFKYQIIDSERKDDKEFIWFDDKDYQLRRSRSETKDSVTEMTFEYDGVSISEPSPVKELRPDQFIVPGQPEPMTMPGAS